MNNFLSNFGGLFKKENSFLGVDIGNFSIKIAEISKEKNNQFKISVLDETIIPKDKKIIITDDEKVMLLLGLIKRNSVKSKKVIFSIENSFSNYAIITSPIIKNKNILNYIKLNFNNFLPVNFEDIYLEWKILKKDKNYTKILLIAVNKNIIIQYKKIAIGAKLSFFSYETEANALSNSLLKKDTEEVVIILDVRMKNSSLSLVEKGNLLKSSSFDISVNYLEEHYKDIVSKKISLNIKKNPDIVLKNRKEIKKIIIEKKQDLKKIQEKSNFFIQKIKEEGDNIILAKVDGTDDVTEVILDNFDFFLKKNKTIKELTVKKNESIINKMKIIDERKELLFKKRKELIQELEKIEGKEEEIEKELIEIRKKENQILSATEYKKIVFIKKNQSIVRRRIEEKRQGLEDKVENIEKQLRDKGVQQKLETLEQDQNVVKFKIKEIKKQQNQIQKFIEKLKEASQAVKKAISLEKDNQIKDENMECKKNDIGKSLDSYFELFYKKIWLFVVNFNNNEKQKFKKIIISGGADFIPGLREYIQEKINQKFTGINVMIADPFTNINNISLIEKPQKNSQFSNAIGAALKGLKKH